MNSFSNGGSAVGKMLFWLVVGVLAVVALKVALVTLGFLVRIALVLLFTLGPLLLVGWLVLKLLRWLTRDAEPAATL